VQSAEAEKVATTEILRAQIRHAFDCGQGDEVDQRVEKSMLEGVSSFF
jgi:hypothetical protein